MRCIWCCDGRCRRHSNGDRARRPAPAHLSTNAEGFTARGVPKIYLLTFPKTYQAAERGDTDAIAKLASIVVNEACHLTGGDEREAYAAQLDFLHRVRATRP
jgi:hypothetical protein